MANRNGQKGSSFERLIADHLRDAWDDRIDRRVKTGSKDKGDIANFRVGAHRVVIECKNVRAMNLSGWVAEAAEERDNDDALVGLVVHKRKGKGQPGDQYVTLTLTDLLTLLHAAAGQGA